MATKSDIFLSRKSILKGSLCDNENNVLKLIRHTATIQQTTLIVANISQEIKAHISYISIQPKP